jgi:hypothetical protein
LLRFQLYGIRKNIRKDKKDYINKIIIRIFDVDEGNKEL